MGQYKHIHFIGIGGIGMSGLARFFVHEKKQVSGSDRATSPITDALKTLGVTFYENQVASNITDGIDFIVYTEAMSEDQEEMVAARNLGVPMMNYFQALGLVANQYYLVAVSGTHGKTTTTAMIIDILEEAELDPTAIVGSLRSKTGSNFRPGKSKYAVVEACEYRRDFLSLTPDVLVITNIEAEHLDYYDDLKDVQKAFRELAEQVRENGTVVANTADSKVKQALEGLEKKVINYGKYLDPRLKLNVPGLHNQMNAAAATAAAECIGVTREVSQKALENFAGTWRRFEYKGKVNGARVYDDYGHHPTEITVTLKGAREMFPDKNILLIYQPHLDSRTERLFLDFVTSISKADRIILAPTYVARNVEAHGVSSEDLAEAIQKVHPNIEYINTFKDIVRQVKNNVTKNDLVLVMGAGDIAKVANMLV